MPCHFDWNHMTPKIVKDAQSSKNHWYKNARKGVIGPILPRPIKKG